MLAAFCISAQSQTYLPTISNIFALIFNHICSQSQTYLPSSHFQPYSPTFSTIFALILNHICPHSQPYLPTFSTIFSQSHNLTHIPFQDLLPFNLSMNITRFSKQLQCSNLFCYFFTCMHAHCKAGKSSSDSSVYRWWFSPKIQRPWVQESTALVPRDVINPWCFPCFQPPQSAWARYQIAECRMPADLLYLTEVSCVSDLADE